MKYFFSFLVFPDSTIKNGFDWYPNWQRWLYCSFTILPWACQFSGCHDKSGKYAALLLVKKKKSLFVSLSSGFWFLWPTTFWNACTAFICIFIKYRKANPHSEHSPLSATNGKHSTNKHHWMTLKTLSLDNWKHQICLNELRLHKHW